MMATREVAALELPRWAVREAVRDAVDARRRSILENGQTIEPIEPAEISGAAARLCRPSLRRLVNATGVVLHTNFGRAPISERALNESLRIASGYSNLEYDIERGCRGSRHGHLTPLIRGLTGAADAAVVNNNAAATLLGLAALAVGKEVIVSRGELVEIGGSFRIPDVMRLSGATLVEVGTTNKTRIEDYRDAITERTGLLLKVHQSNFSIIGFTEAASSKEIAELGKERGIATMNDLGSGCLLSREQLIGFGLADEETVADAVGSGMDLVTFSGDKLLGGAQAGILAGSQQAVGAVRKHPLMRALRPDKLTLSILSTTLAAYRDQQIDDVPAVAMMGMPFEKLRERATSLLAELRSVIAEGFTVELRPVESAVGGGTMPETRLPSWAIAILGASPRQIDRSLRAAPVAVVGRISEDELILDVRTIMDRDWHALGEAVASLGGLE